MGDKRRKKRDTEKESKEEKEKEHSLNENISKESLRKPGKHFLYRVCLSTMHSK